MNEQVSRAPRVSGLAIAALGVVYGDIGTSPLYALRECFHPLHGVAPDPSNVLGVLSLIFWSLALIVSLKYIALVMRADNRGEGGILALLSLAFPEKDRAARTRFGVVLTGLGVFGAAMLYGDGTITPAMTVLSAVEGLEVATAFFRPYIVPITVAVLIGLFSFQRVGTAGVGRTFGPIMLAWFVVIAVLGVREIIRTPQVLAAVLPSHAVRFFLHNGWQGFLVLSAVFLAVTGAEALYADMGHFGRRPIRVAWFRLVFPALLLNYFGQGALLLRHPGSRQSPFFQLAPEWGLYPLVGLATLAAIIASQSLISGAFSLTMQAIQLGYCPRMEIAHTSSAERGQIYVPYVNWLLLLACIALVLGFGSSSSLASAYGVAVIVTMITTTFLFFFAARRLWGWTLGKTGGLCLGFVGVELAFLAANSTKILHGGWFPVAVAIGIYTLMSTWKWGRQLLRERLQTTLIPLDLFLKDLGAQTANRVRGTAVFMAGNPDGVPIALLHNLKHNMVLHERVILLTLLNLEVPHVAPAERLQVSPLAQGFCRVVARYGFMEEPNVPEVLRLCREQNLDLDLQQTTFFLSRETVIPKGEPTVRRWRNRLFAVMSRNAQSATAFFRLPANRVVELGMQVEL